MPPISIPRASATPTSDEQDHKREHGAHLKNDQAFALAAASLRQALQDMPELAEASKHIMVEETKEGLNIDLVDQEGRSMFPEGSKEPYERTRRIIEKLAVPLKATPYRVSITGHTSASKVPPKADYGPWNLSADRANSVRQILEEEGFPPGNIYEVAGRAIPIHSFPRIPTLRPIAEGPSRSCTRRRRFPLGCSRRFDASIKNVARQPSECFSGVYNSSVFPIRAFDPSPSADVSRSSTMRSCRP